MTYRSLLPALLAVLWAVALPADSLVPSGFSGYLTTDGAVSRGSLVRVTISTETRMSFSSSLRDDTFASVSFTGGEGEGLFSFLPSGQAGNSSSAQGEEEAVLETELAARIVEVAEDGSFLLRGSREISVDRATQRVEIEGWGQMSQVDESGRIPFAALADAVLRYTTFTNGRGDVVTGADLEEIRTPVAPPAPQPDGGEAAVAAPPEAAAAETPATAEGEAAQIEGLPSEEPATEFGGYTLSRELRRELLLQYVNQLVDLLFAPATN